MQGKCSDSVKYRFVLKYHVMHLKKKTIEKKINKEKKLLISISIYYSYICICFIFDKNIINNIYIYKFIYINIFVFHCLSIHSLDLTNI